MTGTVDIESWMSALIQALRDAFGERVAFVGLQGSRARGEARPDSDIDEVAIISDLAPEDLRTYHSLLRTLPHADSACGFVSSPDVLKGWPRSDSFNLVMDTTAYFGSLDFMDTRFTAQEAREAAKAGASGIYHAICHGILFDGDALPDIVEGCIKSAFFVMRALAFADTGEYPRSRASVRERATLEERIFLDAYDDPASFDPSQLAAQLMTWSANILA